jgi:hypothetical protein
LSYESQRRFAIPSLGNLAFQDFCVVIQSRPKGGRFAVNLHENQLQMPLPVRIRAHPADPVSSDLSSKHLAKSILPEPNRFMADFDTAFMQKTLQIPPRERKSNIKYRGQAIDFVRGFEIMNRTAFCHP